MHDPRPRAGKVILLAACLAVSASGCRKAPSAPGALHCFKVDQGVTGKPGQGLNPLLGAIVSCNDEASACEAGAKENGVTCSAVLPRWHCYALRGYPKDPLDGLTFCYPSLALCEAARAPHEPLIDEGMPTGTRCRPVETVYCQGNDPSLCADDERLCNMAGEMLAKSLRGSPPHRKCEARHSAREP